MTPGATGASIPLPSRAVLEQAARWYARLRDGNAGVQDRAALQAWLREDEAHRAAWRYVEDISRGFEPLRTLPEPRRAADALTTVTDRPPSRRRRLTGMALLAGGGLFGWPSLRPGPAPGGFLAWSADHRTGTGEQRDITLADGTRLWLNTASAIDIRFTDRERVVVLLEGETFIDTASDAARPFVVRTAHGVMQALGTRFNVRRDTAQTRLTVYEGTVELRAAASGTIRAVPAGRQASFNADQVAATEAANPAREAWTRGALVADNISLREVVDELRRYRTGHLGVADEVAGLTVYGHFPVRDTDRVLRMLAMALPIRVEQRLPLWTTIEAE